ncbi:hypothetical protein BDW02DRAFT_563322 [Decorospora gaudefroyi]|uniref:CCHC-type domain-containing protein n=1 Tax=Decorospora gaudefroyi TaxID=184978 RepID=A0A6A5JXD1_9PLEO|nr:hypothetical protein BDW02DRAFT_563322 [Decorospora gaudefroyi]
MSGYTPKTMSQGLMGMKFMQRAAAKSSPSSPSAPNGPPTKKARLANGASAAGTSDYDIIQAAQVAEEKKRQVAFDKAAQHTGETKWVLSFQDPLVGKRQDGMKVRQAGFAEIDAEDDSDSDSQDAKPVRIQFGGGVKRADNTIPFIKAENSESESESSSDDYDPDDPTAELIRETKREMAAERRESRRARANAANDSSKGTPRRPDEDANLNGLTSLSGGGRLGSGRGGKFDDGMRNVECYRCKQKGHIAVKCPTMSGSAGRGRGRGRGRR